MNKRIIKIGSGYEGEITYFPLRVISMLEESNFLERYTEIADTDAKDKRINLEFDLCVDALASWVAEPIFKKEAGKEVPLFPDAETAAESVRQFFQDPDSETQRIANQVVLNFRSKLIPTVVFQ